MFFRAGETKRGKDPEENNREQISLIGPGIALRFLYISSRTLSRRYRLTLQDKPTIHSMGILFTAHDPVIHPIVLFMDLVPMGPHSYRSRDRQTYEAGAKAPVVTPRSHYNSGTKFY